jgi:hypothetical protein
MGNPEKLTMFPAPTAEQAPVEAFDYGEAVNEGSNYEIQKEQALEEMVTILTNEGYADLPTLAEKATFLRTLILEKAATVGDTSVPVDNANRFLVEALAEKLSLVEKFEDEELASLQKI